MKPCKHTRNNNSQQQQESFTMMATGNGGRIAVVLVSTVLLAGLSLSTTRTASTKPNSSLTARDWEIVDFVLSLKDLPNKGEWLGAARDRKGIRRKLQSSVPVLNYQYNRGNCPEAGSLGVPCSPSNLAQLCSKSTGRFSDCLMACAPSYCCVHDAPEATNPFAPNCNRDENCAQYTPCYIAWWKLADMVGPATEFQLPQNDDFFDVDLLMDVIMEPEFYQQLLFHHFEDTGPILELLGTADSVQEVFANPEIWDGNSGISGNLPPGTR